MYWNILKKDLKRKKTMNMILFLFIILATMFVSSSVNNIITISTALDDYFEKAKVPDLIVFTKATGTSEDRIGEILDEQEIISSYGIEPVTYFPDSGIKADGVTLDMASTGILMASENAKLNYFDENDDLITDVEHGHIYVAASALETSNLSIGDNLTVTIGETSLDFIIDGKIKDACLGSPMVSLSRFMISETDYKQLISDPAAASFKGNLCYINTEDTVTLKQDLSKTDSNIIFSGDRNMLKITYFMHMVIAGCLLMTSVCLILIAFVTLRFTISFTLSEEYREIGVMKAIGIRPVKIRGLYLVKYFVLSLIGALIGVFLGIPFGNVMLQSISRAIVMENGNHYVINILCAMTVLGIITLFCFSCTKKVQKFTPVDAIRNGSKGESYQGKGFLRLGKSRLRPAEFMAFHDIFSGLKRYSIMFLSFTLSITLIIIIVNTINTLKSDQLLPLFSLTVSDAYIQNPNDNYADFYTETGHSKVKEQLKEIEDILEDNGIPAQCAMEVLLKPSLINGDRSYKSLTSQGTGTTTDQYDYIEGTPPQNADEIAVTELIADELDVEIGDTITIAYKDGDREYLITALFQSTHNMGEGVRLHETEEVDYSQIMGFQAIQINFTDDPDDAEVNQRIEKIKEIFKGWNVYTSGEYSDHLSGNAASSLYSVRFIIILIVAMICTLVVILMERSFIAKEQGEIGILKAIGFQNNTIIWYHTLRIGIVLIISAIISAAISTPATKLIVDQVFKLIGAPYGVHYAIHPLEVYVVYPLVILVIVLAAAFLTAQYIRSISPSESSNME